MNEILANAVEIFRTLRSAEDDKIYRSLIEGGVESELAERLIEFLPMVYCRLILASSGAKFPNVFCRLLPNGTFEERLLSSEPVWNAAARFAQCESEAGVSAEDLLAIAGRSAEFHAANQLLQRRSELEDLRFTPTVLRRIEGAISQKDQNILIL